MYKAQDIKAKRTKSDFAQCCYKLLCRVTLKYDVVVETLESFHENVSVKGLFIMASPYWVSLVTYQG